MEGHLILMIHAVQGVAEAESRRAADAAEQAYREEFNRDVSADEGQLDAEHLRALAAAQEVFNEKAVGEAPRCQGTPFLRNTPWCCALAPCLAMLLCSGCTLYMQ